jgi:hypothetical protein
MQRIIPSQLLGISLCYHKQRRFHSIELSGDFESSLAYRAGMKNCDRVICFNDIDIEEDTVDQFVERFDAQLHLPVQMLVCSPATYEHYKSNNKRIHFDLSTVQHLKPVFDISCNK